MQSATRHEDRGAFVNRGPSRGRFLHDVHRNREAPRRSSEMGLTNLAKALSKRAALVR